MNPYTHSRATSKRFQGGFTLIELMIVVAIIGIISAIAYPSYDDYVVKGRRTEAKTIMLRGALWMERNQTSALSYQVDAAGVTLASTALDSVGLGRSPENASTVAAAHYAITLVNNTAAAFEIRATAQGGQATKDPNCGVLVVNHLGQRGIVESGAVSYTSANAKSCWAS